MVTKKAYLFLDVRDMLVVNFIQRFKSMSGVLSGPESALMTDTAMTSPAVDGESFPFVDGASVPIGNGRRLRTTGRSGDARLQL